MLIPFSTSSCLTALNLGKRKDHSTDEWMINAVHCVPVCVVKITQKSTPLFSQIFFLLCGIAEKITFSSSCHSPLTSGYDRCY